MTTTIGTADRVTASVRAHYATLESELIRRTDALLATVGAREAHEPAQRALVEFLREEILPQVAAEQVLFGDAPTDTRTMLLGAAMAAQERHLAGLVEEVDHAATGIEAARAASAVVALFMIRAEEEMTVLLPALAACGSDPTDLLCDAPVPGDVGADATAEAAVPAGDPYIVSLHATGYDECRRRLRSALRELQPGTTLVVAHDQELCPVRFEVEATMPQVYRWSLPTADGDGGRGYTTVVQRL